MAAMLVLIRHEAGCSFVPFHPTTERGKGNDDTKLVTPIPSHLRAGKVIMRRGKGGAGSTHNAQSELGSLGSLKILVNFLPKALHYKLVLFESKIFRQIVLRPQDNTPNMAMM